MTDPYSDEEIGGLGSGPRYPTGLGSRFCVCGHLCSDHDLDDGCGGCAMHMVGPCREFRQRRQGIAPAQGGDVLDDLWWEAE